MPLAAFSCFLLAVFSARGQASFQDLDFEEANIVIIGGGSPYNPFAISAADALPGWTVDYGTVQQSAILYNDPNLGTTAVTLLGNGYGPPIDGNYSVLLQGGVIGNAPTSASISQTGLIPPTAESLVFKVAATYGGFGSLVFYVGTQSVPLTAVGTGADYTLYGGDISALAGQTEQITISAPGQSGNWEIDDITFSPTAVPEPNTLALILMSGLALAARRWWTKGS